LVASVNELSPTTRARICRARGEDLWAEREKIKWIDPSDELDYSGSLVRESTQSPLTIPL
jgi:hypothetical protein